MTIDLEHWNSNMLPTDRAGFDVDAYLSLAPRIEDYNLRQKLEEWCDTGIVIFEQCVSNGLINLFLNDIEYLNEHRSEFSVEVEHRGARYPIKNCPVSPLSDTGIKFNCLENISLAARHLSLTRIVCSFLMHVFQDSPAVLQSLTFWRGSEQAAHLDYPWVREQTKLPHLAATWIPLEDIHEDSGPLAYYPGSHKCGVIDPFDWGGGSLVQEPDSERNPGDFVDYLAQRIQKLRLTKQVFLPKRGDALIWHGSVLHEGTAVRDRSRTRRSYVTHYTSLGAYPELHLFPKAFETKRFTALHGGYVFDHPWVTDERQLPSWQALNG
jgi:phytanoyl-CoA hydroxylase